MNSVLEVARKVMGSPVGLGAILVVGLVLVLSSEPTDEPRE